MRWTRRQDPDAAERGDVDLPMALAAALLGTLTLGGIVGVESRWELLLLLALVAAVGLVFERVALQPRRRPRGARE